MVACMVCQRTLLVVRANNEETKSFGADDKGRDRPRSRTIRISRSSLQGSFIYP